MIQYIKNLKWNRWVQLVLALLIAAFSFIPWHSPLFIRSGISDFQYVIDAIKEHFNFFYFFFYILIPFIAYFIPIVLFFTKAKWLRTIKFIGLSMLTAYSLIGLLLTESFHLDRFLLSFLFLFITMFCLVMECYDYMNDGHKRTYNTKMKWFSFAFGFLHFFMLFIPMIPTENAGEFSHISFVMAVFNSDDAPMMIVVSLFFLILSFLYLLSVFFNVKWIRLARIVVASALLCFDSLIITNRPLFWFPLLALAMLVLEYVLCQLDMYLFNQKESIEENKKSS